MSLGAMYGRTTVRPIVRMAMATTMRRFAQRLMTFCTTAEDSLRNG
jgi:hypothetical protein